MPTHLVVMQPTLARMRHGWREVHITRGQAGPTVSLSQLVSFVE